MMYYVNSLFSVFDDENVTDDMSYFLLALFLVDIKVLKYVDWTGKISKKVELNLTQHDLVFFV